MQELLVKHRTSRLLSLCAGTLALLTPVAQGADPCADFTPLRRAYFGDTHVHTGYSLDAATRFGTRASPDDAYKFARGEPVQLPPYDDAGQSDRTLQLSRPLDFAAVTDHAENLDFPRICGDESQSGSDSWSCQLSDAGNRIAGSLLQRLAGLTGWDVLHHCGADGERCNTATQSVWQDTLNAAAMHNSPCEFTTFNAYEWSGGSGVNMLHRNVLFGSDQVIASPVNSIQAPQAEQLWQALDEQCKAQAGCSAITIPHNSNMSAGHMFSVTLSNGELLSKEVAQQRHRYERLAEIYQHKGSSECFFDPLQSEDELCAFEYLPYSSTLDKYLLPYLPNSVEPPSNDSRFMREALREGFRQRRLLGVNPFMTGFVASTDTHIAAPGATEEPNYAGHHGAQNLSAEGAMVDRTDQGPGGLAVVYAHENTRQSLFAAMQRREVYGTSGTRIGLRFFAGEALSEDLCQRSDMLAEAYRNGSPMGSTLESIQSSEQSPRFLLAATRDPLQGAALQRLQIIKGWVDREGVSQEQVIDVAGNAQNDASVNLTTCAPEGEGAGRLCTLWSDPEFDPDLDAYYYARAIENPSCRWSTHACLAQAVDCSAPQDIPESLGHCCDTNVPKTIQERAWSSPIWYEASN